MEPLTQITHPSRRTSPVRREVVLRVIVGPDRGKAVALGDRPVRIGAAEDNDLVLADERVSHRHCSVERTEGGCLVKDLGSANGTFYRGALMQAAIVRAGAEIRAGDSVFRVEINQDQAPARGQGTFGDLIGSSPAMQEVFGLLATLAPTDLTVLIEGETGTGKELVAEALHRQSGRRAGPLVVVDCAALHAGLIESELFGHERGAFSGADRARDGALVAADGGTLFFDEIGELPLDLQTRLLRVIDRREVRHLGSTRSRTVDVRVIAATNRDLQEEASAGRFRQDLYFRLAVARVGLPPLRERREDIPALARHFLETFGHVDPERVLTSEVVQSLIQRTWPGNVRQLRNFIERVVAMTGREQSTSAVLSAPRPEAQRPPTATMDWLTGALPDGYLNLPYKSAKKALVQQFDRLYILRMLEQHGRNVRRIAREARVDRVLVRRMLRKLNEDDPCT